MVATKRQSIMWSRPLNAGEPIDYFRRALEGCGRLGEIAGAPCFKEPSEHATRVRGRRVGYTYALCAGLDPFNFLRNSSDRHRCWQVYLHDTAGRRCNSQFAQFVPCCTEIAMEYFVPKLTAQAQRLLIFIRQRCAEMLDQTSFDVLQYLAVSVLLQRGNFARDQAHLQFYGCPFRSGALEIA